MKTENDDRVKLERIVPIAKIDEERQIVSAVVYEPNLADAHEEGMTAKEIEKSAHGFMIRYAQGAGELGTDHRRKESRASVVPIESFIAPVDFQLGAQLVKAGSWVLSAKIFDEELWKGVKTGQYTGWSFEGWGLRRPA